MARLHAFLQLLQTAFGYREQAACRVPWPGGGQGAKNLRFASCRTRSRPIATGGSSTVFNKTSVHLWLPALVMLLLAACAQIQKGMTARSAASLQGQIMAVVQHESAQFLVTPPNPAPSLPTPWHEHGVEAQTRIKRRAGQQWLERLRPVDPTAGVAADLARFLQSTYKVQVVGAAGRTTDRPPEEAAAVARDRAGLRLYVLSMGWGVHPPREEHYSVIYHAAAILLDASSGRELARATCPLGIPTAEAIDRAVTARRCHAVTSPPATCGRGMRSIIVEWPHAELNRRVEGIRTRPDEVRAETARRGHPGHLTREQNPRTTLKQEGAVNHVAVSAGRVNGIRAPRFCRAECFRARMVAPRVGPTEDGYRIVQHTARSPSSDHVGCSPAQKHDPQGS